MGLNRRVLHDVISWGEALPGFQKTHAVDGLTLAQCIVDGFDDLDGEHLNGMGARDSTTLPRLTMDTAWIFWLDDCFDSRLFDSRNFGPHDATAGRAGEQAHMHDDYRVAVLKSNLGFTEKPEPDVRLWLATIDEMIRSFRLNELSSRGDMIWTYGEYLDNGESSSAVMHFIVTVALLYDFNIRERILDPAFQRLIRSLSLAMRLLNDLASMSKERLEGDRANALIVMERFLPESAARAFIMQEQAGYERAALRALRSMEPTDPFVRMIRIMLRASAWFYSEDRERYSIR